MPLPDAPEATWVVESGIGETRAALISAGRIVEARIVPDATLTAGTVLAARLVKRLPARNQGIAAWEDGEALVAPLPPDVTEGGALTIEITRPPLPEPGKPKRARARPAPPEAAPGPGPALAATLDGPARFLGPHDPDLLEQAGWSELLEQAATRLVAFTGGALTIALTPAMTLIDVDGETAPDILAVAGARAAAEAVRRLDIAGSIGIDLPTVSDKAVRHAAAEAMDQSLPPPFERTAVNGFGFVQLVRRRSRLSLPELHAAGPALAYARALARRAERSPGKGERTVTAHPDVLAAFLPDWSEAIARTTGAPVALQADAALAISSGHVQARHQ